MTADSRNLAIFTPRRVVVLFTVAMTLTLLAGCANGATTGLASQTASATFDAPTATATVNPYDITPTPGPFVCANPTGSSARYAFVAADHQLTLVQGCSPREILARPNRALAPEAFSPSGQWLLASESSTFNPDTGPAESTCETLINTSTGATTLTPLCNSSTPNATLGWYGFIGWSDDATFYEAGWSVGAGDSVSVVRVTLPNLATTKITTFPWVGNMANMRTPSGIVLRNGALYYAGYASSSDRAHAWLRRHDLARGADTRIVSLGIAGQGGCQVQVDNTPCSWAGPWDISPDGSKITYHVPGPTQSISDTSIEKNTPLYIARNNGSGATRLFPGVALGDGFNAAVFSSDGRYLQASFYAQAVQMISPMIERLSDGSLIPVQGVLYFSGWTSQPGVAVVQPSTAFKDYLQHLALYNLGTRAFTPLQAGSSSYIWA